ILHLLFFMPPPPPRSTLFPYTTLFRSLARRAVRLLARHGIRFPLPVSRFPLSVVDGMGQGYGHPSLEGEAARRLAAEHGLTLDPTYGAKAFAFLLQRAACDVQRVVFWHTFAVP